MKLKEFIFVFVIASILTASDSAISSEPCITDEQATKLPEDYQRLMRFVCHIEDDLNYAGLQTISFLKGNDMAITAFHKDKKNPKRNSGFYMSIIDLEQKGLGLYFRAYQPCAVTKAPRDTTIKISDQKVQASSMCSVVAEGDGKKTSVIYVPKTKAGKDFAYSEFSSKDFVFLELDGVEVPFDTRGFMAAWDEAAKPAL